MQELKECLIKRKYPLHLITDGIDKALNQDQRVLRQVNAKPNTGIIPFVSTFNPNNPEMFNFMKQNVPILKCSSRMKSVLDATPLLKSKRQAHNLKNILTRARYDRTPQTKTVVKCGRGNCGLCRHLVEGHTFNFKNGKQFHVNENITCDVKNVIYVITCGGCAENYIGETGNLRQRVTIHNQQIRDPSTRKIQLSEHIDRCSSSDPKYTLFPFYKMQFTDSTRRKLKEEYFIKIFRPTLNRQ